MLRFPLSSCLIAVLAAIPVPALAQNSAPLVQVATTAAEADREATALTPAAIGTIVETEGTGNLILRSGEDNKAYPAKNGDLVYPGDTMQTGPGAKMLVLFLDDSRFTLGENARLRAEEYDYDDKNSAASKARYAVPQGAFLYAAGGISKDAARNNVKIQTPSGTVSVTNATLWGGVFEEQYNIYLAEGDAILETNRGRIRIANGEGTAIRSLNAIPERPSVWSAARVDRAKEEITLKNVEAVKEKLAASQAKHPDMLIRHKAYRHAAYQSRIEEQKPRDSIKRRDNIPAPAADAVASDETASAAPAPAPLTGNDPAAPSETPAAQTAIAAPVSTPEPGPVKTLNDVSAPLPDAIPTTAEGAAAASAPPKDTVPPAGTLTPESSAEQAPPAEATGTMGGASPAIVIEAETPAEPVPVEQNNVTPPAFPSPPPTVMPAPEDLPSDPAMRQEALEKLNLHNNGTHNPF